MVNLATIDAARGADQRRLLGRAVDDEPRVHREAVAAHARQLAEIDPLRAALLNAALELFDLVLEAGVHLVAIGLCQNGIQHLDVEVPLADVFHPGLVQKTGQRREAEIRL